MQKKLYNSYSDYFTQLFGGRAQKVTINAGFTCPNRDGSKGTGGCIYCDNEAFNPSYCLPEKSIYQQITEGIEFHQRRYRRAVAYLAYFQAFSNTYSDIDTLKRKYTEALSHFQVKGLIIGTRPDCINEDVCELLNDISKSHYINVELGVESVYDKTLLKINRGHDFKAVTDAFELLNKYNLNSGAHLIFGLPGETEADWMESLDIINNLPVTTIKFHQLQLIKNTEIEKMYFKNPNDFVRMNKDEYIKFIIRFVERLNPNFIIERFAGEVPPRFLSDSNWGIIRYDQVVREIEQSLSEQNTFQGRLYESKKVKGKSRKGKAER